MTAPVSLLDAITPDPGYHFTSGVWCTHDLTVSAVNDWLLPALTGIQSRERLTLAAAPSNLAPGALLVLAAADRITTAGLLPDAVTVLPVHGRRQHAKVAILRYESVRRQSRRWYALTIVASANLTHGGLSRNRELIAVERVDQRSTSPTIATAALAAIRTLRDEVPSHRRAVLARRLTELHRGLPPSRGASSVVHSLDGPPEQPFPAYIAKGPAERLLLIGPAFAADDSDVASLLTSVLDARTHVDLVVDGGASRDDLRHGRARVRVPSRLLSGLKRVASSVTVHATPTDGDAASGRRLHGKTVMAQYGDSALMLVGSVNITRTGLAGRNRELAVVANVTGADAIERELELVQAVMVPTTCLSRVSRSDSTLPPTVSPSAAPLMAVFIPDQGQHFGLGVISGVLTVEGVGPRTVITVDGARVQLKHGQARVQFDPVHGLLRIASGPRAGVTVVVSVSPSDGGAFWQVPADIGSRRDDPLLALLQADVERAVKRSQRRGDGRPTAGGNDAFSLPGNVRLNALVRHRNVLATYDREQQDAIVSELFHDDRAECDVATAVMQASRGDQVVLAQRNPLVRALVEALDETSRIGK